MDQYLSDSFHSACELLENGLYQKNIHHVEQSALFFLKWKDSIPEASAKLLRALTSLCILNPQKALDYMSKAIEIAPEDPIVLNNIAYILHKDLGYHERSFEFYQNCLKTDPKFETAYMGMLDVIHSLRLYHLEKNYIEKGLKNCPDSIELKNSQGLQALYDFKIKDHITFSRACFQDAISKNPETKLLNKLHLNLGHLENVVGNTSKGIQSYIDAISAHKESPLPYGNILLNLHYLTRQDWFSQSPVISNLCSLFNITIQKQDSVKTIVEKFHDSVAKTLYKCSKEPVQPSVPTQIEQWCTNVVRNDIDPSIKLHIGFIGADFYGHAVSLFTTGFMKCLWQRPDIHISIWSNTVYDTVIQKELACHEYHCIKDSNTEKVVSMMKSSKVDVLVDLSGHTSGNRLDIVSQCPAVLHLSMVGYPNTTGIPFVKRISDKYCDPTPDPNVVCFDRIFLCYSPTVEYTSLIPKQHKKSGMMTLGCFGKLPKINSELIQIWKRVLHKYKHARLILKSKFFADSNVLADWKSRFSPMTHRVIFMNGTESSLDHMNLFKTLDIHLDTYPYSGTTITTESLFMNVPVVTFHKRNDPHVSKVSGSILTTLGLSECIAHTPEEYVNNIKHIYNNAARLQVRDRMLKSKFMNPQDYSDTFVGSIADTFRSGSFMNSNVVPST